MAPFIFSSIFGFYTHFLRYLTREIEGWAVGSVSASIKNLP